MLRRWHVLLVIVVTLAAFCALAAAKLRATPKYDRIEEGMTLVDAMPDEDVSIVVVGDARAMQGESVDLTTVADWGSVTIVHRWQCDDNVAAAGVAENCDP